MEQLVQGIEKLLWFFYRIIFVLFPAFVFVFCAYLILMYHRINFPNEKLDKLLKDTIEISSFNRSIIFLGIAVVTSVIIEALAEAYFNFDKNVIEDIEHDNMFTKFQPFIKRVIKDKFDVEIDVSATDLGHLMRFEIMQNHLSFNNYVWFIYVSYKLAVNTAIYLLIGITVFFPYLYCVYNDNNFTVVHWLYFFQIGFLPVHIASAKFFASKSKEFARSTTLKIYDWVMFVFLIVGVTICNFANSNYFLTCIGINLLFFPIFLFLIKFSLHYRGWVRKILVDTFISTNAKKIN